MKKEQYLFLRQHIYPDAIAVFAFDNSLSHGAFAPDALNARAMNVNSEGK